MLTFSLGHFVNWTKIPDFCELCFFRIIALLQFAFSSCVTAVKCLRVLHHCTVLHVYSGPMESWSVYCLHLKIKLCARGVNWLACFFPLMSRFNTTEATIFRIQTMLPYDFPFLRIFNIFIDIVLQHVLTKWDAQVDTYSIWSNSLLPST